MKKLYISKDGNLSFEQMSDRDSLIFCDEAAAIQLSLLCESLPEKILNSQGLKRAYYAARSILPDDCLLEVIVGTPGDEGYKCEAYSSSQDHEERIYMYEKILKAIEEKIKGYA